MGDKIENYISKHYPKIKTHYVIQTTGRGTGYAIYLAKEFITGEILIVLGDSIVDSDLKSVFKEQVSMLGVKKVDDPRLFGVAELDDNGFIKKLVEKPMIPKSNLALVGIYKIKESDKLVEALEYHISNKLTSQNEYQLTDALMYMVEKGVKLKTFDVDNWFDCGKKEILLETNSILLKRLNYDNSNYRFESSIIIPPVFIGEKCKISNSIIGPNVSIGDNTILNYAIVKESIIGPYAQIEYAILDHSIIGNDAMYKGLKQSLNIGDSTEINFG
ncbi:MAG: sugar phosphate nucleotidyltransferase [Bacteroidia bacterium]